MSLEPFYVTVQDISWLLTMTFNINRPGDLLLSALLGTVRKCYEDGRGTSSVPSYMSKIFLLRRRRVRPGTKRKITWCSFWALRRFSLDMVFTSLSLTVCVGTISIPETFCEICPYWPSRNRAVDPPPISMWPDDISSFQFDDHRFRILFATRITWNNMFGPDSASSHVRASCVKPVRARVGFHLFTLIGRALVIYCCTRAVKILPNNHFFVMRWL